MSWIQKLCEVYDTMAGAEGCDLLPIGFARKKIKYHVVLTSEGTFDTAYPLADEEQLCAVPSTPQAEGRTGSNGAPFPLADNLKYLVGGQADAYLRQLADWCQAEDAPDCLKILYSYLEKKTLLQDLMGVPNLKLRYHKDEEKQDGAGPDAKSMVCFSVQSASPTDTSERRLWMRRDVRESWTRRFAALSDETPALCYATGERLPILQNHPKLSGNAKLISAKDVGFPFQYKGRFVADRSAAEVSVMASTKVHNALRWLLQHQGFTRYGMSLVAWNTSQPSLEPEDLFDEAPSKRQPDTFEPYALALRDATAGYLSRLRGFSDKATEEAKDRMQKVVILGLQAATDGRMSITYYQELPGNLYVARLNAWAEDCQWEFPGKERQVRTPTWWEICEAVMGREATKIARTDLKGSKSHTKQLREMQLRLLSCAVNGSRLPKNFLQQAFHHAVQPLQFVDGKGTWNSFAWTQCVALTCALFRKVCLEEKKDRSDADQAPSWVLDVENRDRDYLYGRLLAVAHKVELDVSNDKNIRTTAIRQMAHYIQQPDEAWLRLYPKLLPSLRRIGRGQASNRARAYQRLFGEIERRFRPEDRARSAPLSVNSLVGFSAQLRELFLEKDCRQATPGLPPFVPPKQRDELYGCLLAVADHYEWMAVSFKRNTQPQKSDLVSRRDGRTNAMLLTSAYLTAPARTWLEVHDKLIPYLEALGVEKARYAQRLLRRIELCFSLEERRSAAPLGSLFLHGYLGMRNALLTKGGLDWEAWKAQPPHQLSLEDRNAVFGALLALENQVERWVLDRDKTEQENRPSNAMRFLPRAARRPDEVVPYLLRRMQPYREKSKFPNGILKKQVQLQTALEEHGWDTTAPLGPSYLHAFYTYYVIEPTGKEG